MSIGRSKFYVSTPLEYRHSMLADISPASSSSTIPSVAGSIDCLTDPHKKKKKSFSSKFSIRPFFSSISSLNKSSSEPRRRDSSSQTDDRTANEVGVQTQIAHTVDVPVQTGFGGEWAENHGSKAFPASSSFSALPSRLPGHFTRPGNDPFPIRRPRGPAAGHFARRSDETDITGEHVLTPLDASRVLKYATPCDSATDGSTYLIGKGDISLEDVKRVEQITSGPVPCQSSYQESTLISSSAEYSSKPNNATDHGTGDKKSIPQISAAFDNQNLESTLISSSNEYSFKSDSVINTESGDKRPQVSAKLVNFFDKPSALKVERTDSPVRHSAKIKTVHFDLSDLNPNATNEIPLLSKKDVEPACLNGSKNLDKDFEDLLRNLDILVDDSPPIDSCEISKKAENLKISFDLCQSSPLKQTLLSTRLGSAFAVLHQEVLPPILETYENYVVEPSPNETHTTDALPVDAPSNEAHTTETNELITKINPVDDSKESLFPTTELNSTNNLNTKDDSAKPASGNVFTSSKSVGANDVNPENVYESELNENIITTLSLPTLPSFFDSVPKISQLDVYSVSPKDFQSEVEEKMLSRSSSRGSVRNNLTSDFDGFLTSAKNRFDSCDNLDQLEEEIIRSLCEPIDLAHTIPTNQLPAHEIPTHDVAHVRRVALKRLLSGDVRSNDEVFRTPEEIIEVPESKISSRQTHKHVATITKLDCHRNNPELECLKQISSDNLCLPEFYLPEHKPLNTDNLIRTPNDHSSDTSSSRRNFHEIPSDGDASGTARTCDFAHCLRPSEIRNSPFLDKISFRSSPDKSPVRSVSPVLLTRTKSFTSQALLTEAAKIPNSNEQCNFEHCLKPSQMQNSAFLNDITPRKLAPNISQLASSLNSSQIASSSSPPAVNTIDFQRAEKTKSDETSHKSEITIVLKMPYGGLFTDEQKSVQEVETPSLSSNQPASVRNEKDETVPPVMEAPLNSVDQQFFVPSPPPSFSNKRGVMCHPSNVAKSTMESVLQNHPPSPVKSSVDQQSSLGEPKNSPNKSPVMMELEKCFEARRRYSADELDHHSRTGLSNSDSKASPEKRSHSFEFHPPPATLQCAGSRAGGREPPDCPAIVTDSAPLPGAVLMDERVTVDAGLRHTDRLFGLPVREVRKETTRTAHFRPAPPKYEGIGPTEDGVPLAPRNSVKKEHMHDWYKTMYKSLHKADSLNDNQEYIIGYSSEPETSQREKSPREKARPKHGVKGKDYSEIPLQKDDVVLIARQLDQNWYEGERGGRAGIFPLSYVQIVPPEHAPFPSSTHGSARLIYDFTAQAPVELSVRKGDCVTVLRRVDANWYEAMLNGRKGIVPSSYLHVTHEPTQNSAPSPQPSLRSTNSSKGGRTPSTNPRPPLSDASKGKKSGDLIEPVMYRALYAYTPLHSDELELREGEAVCVVERCDDGWFVGAAADSGRFGIFPGNYVEKEENEGLSQSK